MSYVRGKTRYNKQGKATTYYYLVEGVRDGTRVRQRVIKYLGKDVPDKAVSVASERVEAPVEAPVEGVVVRGHRFEGGVWNKKRDFCRENVNNIPDGHNGVYWLYDKDGVCLWVGSGVDVKKRLLRHLGASSFSDTSGSHATRPELKNASAFKVVPCLDVDEMRDKERDHLNEGLYNRRRVND